MQSLKCKYTVGKSYYFLKQGNHIFAYYGKIDAVKFDKDMNIIYTMKDKDSDAVFDIPEKDIYLSFDALERSICKEIKRYGHRAEKAV